MRLLICSEAETSSVSSSVTSLLTTKTTTSPTLFARLRLADQPETVLGKPTVNYKKIIKLQFIYSFFDVW